MSPVVIPEPEHDHTTPCRMRAGIGNDHKYCGCPCHSVDVPLTDNTIQFHVGYWCPRGGGHIDLLDEDDGGHCGAYGYPLYLECPESEMNELPEWIKERRYDG